jgi:sulfoxide reductase heme-binding subunit YedZ
MNTLSNIFNSDIAWSWLTIRASGVVAWALLSAVVFWGLFLRTRILGKKSTPVNLLHLHRWLGTLALVALAVHLGALLIDPVVKFTIPEILVPGLASWQPIPVALGTLALWCMLPVSLIGRIRTKMGKKGNAFFKKSHLIAYFAWPLATAHYVLAGTDAMAQWSIALVITVSVILIFLLLARGFVQPARRTPSPRTPSAPSSTSPTTTTLASENKETMELPEMVEPRELQGANV